MNYGLCFEKPDPQAHIFAGIEDEFPVLNTSGQWDTWLPVDELQRRDGVESNACATFGTLSAIEILLKHKYGQDENYSDRWLAWNSGTDPKRGNDPHRVSETLRKAGVPYEVEWPFAEDFYTNPPPKLFETARGFTERLDYRHKYVKTTEEELKDALTRSPLGVSVTAWRSKDGVFYARKGTPNNHWCVLYGYDDAKKCWKIFDSYDNTRKLYTYGSSMKVAKVYRIDIKPAHQQSFLIFLLEKLKQLLSMQTLPTKRELLLATVKKSLGIDASPADRAPDELACVETVDTLFHKTFGRYIDKRAYQPEVSTYRAYLFLNGSAEFEEVKDPSDGTIVISPSGFGYRPMVPNGHIGVCDSAGNIYSNNSPTGTLEKNYTVASWRRRWEGAQYPVKFFNYIG
jgi:hypothetical protein